MTTTTTTTPKESVEAVEEDDWKDEDFLSFEPPANDNGSEGRASPTNSDMEVESDTDDPRQRPASAGASLPPWMDQYRHRHMDLMTAFHNEIVGFCALVEPMPIEIQRREKLIAQIRKVVQKEFGASVEVKVFGSQATGLFLPSSDIDLVIKTNEKQDDDTENADVAATSQITSPLHRFADAVREEWRGDLSYLEVIENTKVPLVKFTHATFEISVDVCFDQPNGPEAAHLMHAFLNALPPLRPLTFVLKYFLAARALNIPYSGGVGSYLLQLMIVAFLQHRERYARQRGLGRSGQEYNLGALLLEFLEMYGLDFNYCTTGISVRYDGFFFPKGAKKEQFWLENRPFSLAMENPLDPAMDVGRASFRVQMVQRAFAVAFKMLLAHVAEPATRTVSILGTILPISDELEERKLFKRQYAPLKSKRDSDGSTRPVKRAR